MHDPWMMNGSEVVDDLDPENNEYRESQEYHKELIFEAHFSFLKRASIVQTSCHC